MATLLAGTMLAKLLKPFHFKLFFSRQYFYAQVLDKVTNVAIASISSSNRAFDYYLGEKANKNSTRACELAGKMLAHKCKEKQIPTIYWDGVINQKSNRRKYHIQADKIWDTLEAEGLVLSRDEPPSQKEMEDRRREAKLGRRKGLDRESRIDPRFRQQMWKLMRRRPKKQAVGAEDSEGSP